MSNEKNLTVKETFNLIVQNHLEGKSVDFVHLKIYNI